jgi:hypothetical protein
MLLQTTSSRMDTSLRTGGTEKAICEIRFFAAGVVAREHVNIGTACNDFTVPSGPELITSRISTAFPMVDMARALLSLNA